MPKSAESEVKGELEVLVSSLRLTNHTPHTTLQADQGRRRSSKIKTTHHTSPHTLLNHTSPHLTTCTFKPHLTTLAHKHFSKHTHFLNHTLQPQLKVRPAELILALGQLCLKRGGLGNAGKQYRSNPSNKIPLAADTDII